MGKKPKYIQSLSIDSKVTKQDKPLYILINNKNSFKFIDLQKEKNTFLYKQFMTHFKILE